MLAVLGGCDRLSKSGDDDDVPASIQILHPSAVVFQVRNVLSAGDRTAVSIHVANGRDREVKLNSGTDRSYIVTESGEKLMLIDAPTNPDLAIPPGKSMDGTLVFAGSLPATGTATLILNDRDSRDSMYTSTPRLEAVLTLRPGQNGGAVPDASALSNMVSVPLSTVGPAKALNGTDGSIGGVATSSLQAVAELKTELGAVDTDRGTVVSLPGDITFDFDKSSIQSGGRTVLDRLADLIAASADGEIIIEGHTDSKGDDEYNRRLSQQRAEAVKLYLEGKGVAPNRMKTIGLGEARPIAPNAQRDGSDDEEGRQRNRRVEVILPKSEVGQSL